VAPGVEGWEGDFEVVGELLCGEERVEVVHSPTLGWDPVISVLFECQEPFHSDSISVVSPAQGVFLEMLEIGASRVVFDGWGGELEGF
jgi:hypothetical protein